MRFLPSASFKYIIYLQSQMWKKHKWRTSKCLTRPLNQTNPAAFLFLTSCSTFFLEHTFWAIQRENIIRNRFFPRAFLLWFGFARIRGNFVFLFSCIFSLGFFFALKILFVILYIIVLQYLLGVLRNFNLILENIHFKVIQSGSRKW